MRIYGIKGSKLAVVREEEAPRARGGGVVLYIYHSRRTFTKNGFFRFAQNFLKKSSFLIYKVKLAILCVQTGVFQE